MNPLEELNGKGIEDPRFLKIYKKGKVLCARVKV